jgi:DNA polymerase-3 subunit delta'
MLFSQVIGQESVKMHLLKSVKDGRVSHAYLLAGAEGFGSLPLAVAFAQYINCMNQGEVDACGTCSSCVKTAKLVHPDLHFVFPVVKKGSSTPVSDEYISDWRSFFLSNPYFSSGQWFANIADEKKSGMIYSEESMAIIRKLSLKNFEGKFKIMVIWLPEKMNETGANKLLKILEEPPSNTVFLLVSENPEALLGTILSRTQRIDVPPIETAVLSAELQKRFFLSADEADVLTRLSGGSFVKALDNLDSNIDKSGFLNLFAKIMRAAYGRKIFEIVGWVDEVSPMSRDNIKNFLTYAIGMLRDSFIFNFKQPGLVSLSAGEQDFVSKFSPFINNDNLLRMVEELELAYAHIDQNGNARIVLFDMALKMVGMFKV